MSIAPPLTPIKTLTPSSSASPSVIRRRKRASFSPQKRVVNKPRTSDPFPSMPRVPPPMSIEFPQYDLEYPFTYYNDENRRFQKLDDAQTVQLLQLLRQKFPVVAITPMFPYLVIECDKELPSEDERPFLVAGLIAVFTREEEPFPFGIDFIGVPGEGEEYQLPEPIVTDLKEHHIPSLETLIYIHKILPNAQYVSSYPTQILVECHQVPENEFGKLIQSAPSHFGELFVGYVNGELIKECHGRAKTPNPTFIDGEHDDTDYLRSENGGVLRPGVLLECKGILKDDGSREGVCYTNSGIKVAKDGDVRMTGALHGWDGSDDKTVYHGDKAIGVITASLGEDIALIETSYPFNNRLLDYDVIPQKLVPSGDVEDGDTLILDSCYTGVQQLYATGRRTGLQRRKGDGPRNDTSYIRINQGIYAMNSSIIRSPPQIREGACGTPLVRVGNKRKKAKYDDGGVVGFWLWADIKGYGTSLFAFAQTVDPLIEDGWAVCQ
jgi:hypothetical protein